MVNFEPGFVVGDVLNGVVDGVGVRVGVHGLEGGHLSVDGSVDSEMIF